MIFAPLLVALASTLGISAAARASKRVISHPGITPLPEHATSWPMLQHGQPVTPAAHTAPAAHTVPAPSPAHPSAANPPGLPNMPPPAPSAPEPMQRMAAWMKANLTPAQDKQIGAMLEQLASSGHPFTPETACGVMRNVLNAQQMASLVVAVPELADACAPGAVAPSVVAPPPLPPAPPAPTPEPITANPAFGEAMTNWVNQYPATAAAMQSDLQALGKSPDQITTADVCAAAMKEMTPEQFTAFSQAFPQITCQSTNTVPPAPTTQATPAYIARLGKLIDGWQSLLSMAASEPSDVRSAITDGSTAFNTWRKQHTVVDSATKAERWIEPTAAEWAQQEAMLGSVWATRNAAHGVVSPASTAPGLNLALAKSLAPSVEASIKAKGMSYDKALLKRFQVAAGLSGDGLYGGMSAGALTYFLGHKAPAPLYNPKTVMTYKVPAGAVATPTTNVTIGPAVIDNAVTPVASGINLALAKSLAPSVESSIKTKKASYDKALLKRFQTAAGITPDGLYGGYTAGALTYFLGHAAPAPLVNPKTVVKYVVPGTAPAAPVTPQTPKPPAVAAMVDLTLAKTLAPQLETNIKAKGKNYDHALLTRFQLAAGIKGDGLYGGSSAGALAYFLGRTAPKPLYNPMTVVKYNPPGTPVPASPTLTSTAKTTAPAASSNGIDLTLAASLAPKVEANIVAKKSNYDRNLLKQFQVATGLVADGLYGGSSAGALQYFLHHNAPKPLFAPTTIKPYTPPGSKAATPAAAPVAVTTDWTQLPPIAATPAEAAKGLRDYLMKTGDFGSKAAPSVTVRRYQKALGGGLVTDGIVGPKVRAETAKYGIVLPVKGATSTATDPTADIMKSRPSALLALRSTEGPTNAQGAVAGAASVDMVPAMTPAQAKAMFDATVSWAAKNISMQDEILLYRDFSALASERGETVSLPLSYTQVARIVNDPAVACAAMMKTIGQSKLDAFFKAVPTTKARWALFCANKLQMPEGFSTSVWNSATDAQRRQIVINWLPGVAVVTPAKAGPVVSPAAAATQPQTKAIAPAQSTAPVGYNPAEAKRLGRLLTQNVQAKSYDYDRGLCRNFQIAAGLKPDGIYGGATVGALKFYGNPRAPKAMFKPTAEVPYNPPA